MKLDTWLVDLTKLGLLLVSGSSEHHPLSMAIRQNLPKLADEHREEVDALYKEARFPDGYQALGIPFRAPHHTISLQGLSGTPVRPGELALANHGFLFLYDVPEFSKTCLEAIESACRLGRDVHGRRTRFRLVAIMSSSPCGKRPFQCDCSPDQIRRYGARVDVLRKHFRHTITIHENH